MRIYAWKRPADWRVEIESKLGQQYGYSTWLIVAAWRALAMYFEIRKVKRLLGDHGSER